MAAHTQHPVSAPPAAPAREKTGHLLLRGWCIVVLALAISGVSPLMVIGTVPSAILAVATGLVSAILWVSIRPPVQWRRLPWFAVGYVTWATLSLVWSAWLGTSALTLLLLLITTMQALFVGAVLTWREIVRAVASALKWILSLSILFELWVSLVWGGPILPQFVRPDGPVPDPIVYWSRDNLFDGGRIQGIFGNANPLAWAALLALVVFAIRFAANAPRRGWLVAWMALAAFLFVRAGSATALLAAVFVAVVLATVLIMRTTRRPGQRTRYYVAYAGVAIVGIGGVWAFRDSVFELLGRSSDLTGREQIWAAVFARAGEHPVIGWGFATPWLPWESAFDGWIVDHGETVMQAHNMWIDVTMQLGIVGLALLALVYLAFFWRSWFFAVDRPRWDIRADRPYSPLTLLPTLVGAILLVQGMAESAPLLSWGWMFVVMFAFKIKQSPLIGVGPAEHAVALESGDQPKPAA